MDEVRSFQLRAARAERFLQALEETRDTLFHESFYLIAVHLFGVRFTFIPVESDAHPYREDDGDQNQYDDGDARFVHESLYLDPHVIQPPGFVADLPILR